MTDRAAAYLFFRRVAIKRVGEFNGMVEHSFDNSLVIFYGRFGILDHDGRWWGCRRLDDPVFGFADLSLEFLPRTPIQI